MRRELVETIKLALPLALAQLAQFFMGVVDFACVGRYSPEAMAGVAIGNSLSWGLSSIGLGITMALDPLIAQALGAGEEQRAYQWWRVGRVVALLVGLPLVICAVVLAANLHLFGIEEVLAQETFYYVLARGPAQFGFLVYFAGRSYLQALGRTKPLVLAAIVSNIVNLVLDLLLVFGDEGLVSVGLPAVGIRPMGAMGVGFTTACSSVVLALMIVVGARYYGPKDRVWKGPKLPKRTMLRLGLPIGIQVAGESWLFASCGVLAGSFGAVASSAHQVGLTMAASAFMVALGVSGAASARVGRAVGAHDHGGARRAGMAGILVVSMIMAVTATLFLSVPEFLARIITNQPDVIAAALPLFTVGAAFALFDGAQVVMGSALRGAGDVKIPSVLALFGYWVVGFPVAMYCAFGLEMGVIGFWYGFTAGLSTVSILLGLRFWWLTGRPIDRAEKEKSSP
jgi:multidrug resistance protein, MATE family